MTDIIFGPRMEFAGKNVHMVGIGGSGMAPLAELLLRRGARVSGSDIRRSAAVDRLGRLGAKVYIGHDAMNLPQRCDLLVYSAAVPPRNPERIAATERGIKCVRYAQLLGVLMSDRTGIAVSGTHGKSTTTALVAYLLRQAGADPTFVVGAEVPQLGGGSGVGDGPHMVVEACEYQRSFLNLQPHLAAILNVEPDHLDYYRDIEEITTAFGQFAAAVRPDGVLIVNGRDEHAVQAGRQARAKCELFGTTDDCHWRAERINSDAGRYGFRLLYNDRWLGEVRLRLLGRHNVFNALAAAALAYHAGLAPAVLVEQLCSFEGLRRRLTLQARISGVVVLDDYAHHPTEVRASLAAVRERYKPRRLWCVFQPHQYSRTRLLLEEFATSFAAADRIIVPDIYSVRDSAQERARVNAAELVRRICAAGKEAEYLREMDEIVERLLGSLDEGDVVVTMGAGNIWKVADGLVCGLERLHQPR